MDKPCLDGVCIRAATPADFAALDAVREAAFAPVFAGFRARLGDDLYELTQAGDDAAQGAMLSSLLLPGSGAEVFAAERAGQVLGFVTVRMDAATGLGEIGLNAVAPNHAGQGIGTLLYTFALDRMRRAGMRAAWVSTGGDDSHAAARRAYAKAGFDASIPSVWMCRAL